MPSHPDRVRRNYAQAPTETMAVQPCDICEMGLPAHAAWRSRAGRPMQVICNACLDARTTALAGALALSIDREATA